MLKIVKLIDLAMITIPFAACWYGYYSYQVYAKFGWKGNWAMIGLFAVLFFLLGKVYDAFWMSLQRISELIYGQVLAAMATDGILYIVICLMSRRLCNILPGIAAIAGQVVMATLWARCAHTWYFRTFPPQPTAVVYDVRHGLEKLINEYGLSKKYDVRMTLNVEECLSDLSLLDGMKTVFISGVHSHERNIILKYCVGQGINVFVIPRVGDVIMSGSQPMHMFHLPVLRVGRYMASPEYLFVKRAMDIVISLIALIILSPLLLITAIAVKSDGGPAFYKQVRLTKDGKQFEILKFRSMRVDAEKDGVARLSTGDKDDRITKVGHIIRACRLDELPQLLNILKGDLSIVGPRPERPEIAAQYCEEMPEFALRLQAKAGLTGYAQVYGKYNTTPYDKLQMDLMYIAHPQHCGRFEDHAGNGEDFVHAGEHGRCGRRCNYGNGTGDGRMMQEDFGLISIIMAAYNTEKTIEQAINSVLSQTYTNFELLVVNDCSTDRTAELVKSIAAKDSRVRLISNVKNSGVSYTRKHGLEEAKGSWIAILDSDDAWAPKKLEKQIDLQRRTNADLLFTGSAFMDSDGQPIDWYLHAPAEVTYRQLLKQNVLSNSSALVRKELYAKHYAIGDGMHEDFAIWLSILKEGKKAYGVDERLLIYRIAKSSKSGNKFKAAKMNWNTYRYVGLNPIEAAYYECWYMVNGFLKYRNIRDSKKK